MDRMYRIGVGDVDRGPGRLGVRGVANGNAKGAGVY